MKNKLLLTLLALVCVLCCVFSFAACDPADNGDDGDNGDNVDTAEITAEKWSQAFTALAGSTNYTIAMGKDFVKLDGAKLHMKWEDGDMILAKEGSDYFVYLKEEGESAWQKSDGTEEEYNEYAAMYKTMVAAGANALKDKFSTFTYADGVYTAAKLDMGEDLGEVKNLKVKFNNGALVSVEFTATMDSADIAMSLKDLGATSVSLPQVEQPEQQTFTITFKNGDTTVKEVEIVKGEALTLNDIPNLDLPAGKALKAWIVGEGDDARALKAGMKIDADIVANAQLMDVVTVTFKNDEEEVNALTIEKGSELDSIQLRAPEGMVAPSGQVFLYWQVIENLAGIKVEAGYQVNADVVLHAVFGYNVTFTALGETKTLKVLPEYEITADDIPADPVQENALFLGWFIGEGDDEVELQVGLKVNKNINIVAKFNFNKLTVTFKVGEEVIDTFETFVHSALIGEVPTLEDSYIPEGQVFAGWFVGEGDDAVEVIAGQYRITANVDAYAKFEDDEELVIGEAYIGEWEGKPNSNTTYTITITENTITFNEDGDDGKTLSIANRNGGGYTLKYEFYGETHVCELYLDGSNLVYEGDNKTVTLAKKGEEVEEGPFANTTWASGEVRLVFPAVGMVVNGTVQFQVNAEAELKNATVLSYDEEERELKISLDGETYWLYCSSSHDYWDVEVDGEDYELRELKNVNTTWTSQDGKTTLILVDGTIVGGAVKLDIDGSGPQDGTITNINQYGLVITVEGKNYDVDDNDSYYYLYNESIDLYKA